MKKIIISEEQEKQLAEDIKQDIYQMPVPEKANKPYVVDPYKVLIIKNYLDNGFKKGTFTRIGNNGFPEKVKVVAMMDGNGNKLKDMYFEELYDLLCARYEKMYSEPEHVERFIKQVADDWFDDKISVLGVLSKNFV